MKFQHYFLKESRHEFCLIEDDVCVFSLSSTTQRQTEGGRWFLHFGLLLYLFCLRRINIIPQEKDVTDWGGVTIGGRVKSLFCSFLSHSGGSRNQVDSICEMSDQIGRDDQNTFYETVGTRVTSKKGEIV